MNENDLQPDKFEYFLNILPTLNEQKEARRINYDS